MSSVACPSLPLCLGAANEFALAQEFFRRANFDDQTLCRLLSMSDMSDLGTVRWDEIKLDSASDSLRWCIRVFLRGLPAPRDQSRVVCGQETLSAFLSLGLLRAAKKEPSSVLCPVWVYPVDSFVVASDRREDPDGEPYNPPADVVFPAIYAGTLRFLRLLPDAAGAEALDLCGGSGIGGLQLSRKAQTAATADVTERAAFFAEFNARLNGVPLQSFCGDLYQPVIGRQFDLISAHPPFVPATGQNMVYRDGGETGEEITRRAIEGLPDFLRPGGTCIILCVARDTRENTFEQRVRGWLGAQAEHFEIVFGLEKILPVEEVVDSMRKRGQQIDEEQARGLLARLRSLSTLQFVYGALLLRRHHERVAQEPCRVRITPTAGARDFFRFFEWLRFRRQDGLSDWVAQCRPRLPRQLQLTSRHVVADGQLIPAEFVFSIQEAFPAALRPDAWVVPLIARFDGKRSVNEVFQSALTADELPDGFGLATFVELVRLMIDKNLLEVDFPAAHNL